MDYGETCQFLHGLVNHDKEESILVYSASYSGTPEQTPNQIPETSTAFGHFSPSLTRSKVKEHQLAAWSWLIPSVAWCSGDKNHSCKERTVAGHYWCVIFRSIFWSVEVSEFRIVGFPLVLLLFVSLSCSSFLEGAKSNFSPADIPFHSWAKPVSFDDGRCVSIAREIEE